MTINTRILSWPRLTASLVFIVFSSFAISQAQTIPAPGEKIFNLADFAPVADGIADDGPALQRAVNALAEAGGGTLFIPAGSYRIATPVIKDFSALNGAKVKIQGVPSTTMPAPVTAFGHELAAGLDLTSEIIPATGELKSAITLSNLDQLTIEHVVFTGTESSESDAFITLHLTDIDNATVRHCEFYGLSSFGVTELGGGNIVRAVRSELSIELSVFLGCTGSSGAYAPVVENIEWRKFSVSSSIFLDYGLRSFGGKTGLGAPLSWIGIENAAPASPESPRREVIVRDTFLDEGGWVGISVLPYRWVSPPPPIDLIYITGLQMNVANMGTVGHLIYDVRNILIENSHYSWSTNATAALDINRVENAILDNLTCIDHADRIRADELTGRLTVINSVYQTLDSLAATTTVLETTPEQDPVQYVRHQFVAVLGRQPDPAAHFYWSDRLIKCGANKDCGSQQRSELTEYLNKRPQANFSLTGTVTDEDGKPVSGAEITLTGSQSTVAMTDSQGSFRFSGLPTSGAYTVAVDKPLYGFTTSSQTFVHPAADVTANFVGTLTIFSLAGIVTDENGEPLSGANVSLSGSKSGVAITDAQGSFRFPGLPTSGSYTVAIDKRHYSFGMSSHAVVRPEDNVTVVFSARLNRHSIGGRITRTDGTGISGVVLQLAESPITATTDLNGFYSFSELAAGEDYTVLPSADGVVFSPVNTTFQDLSADRAANFVGKVQPELLIVEGSEFAVALDAVSLVSQPFSISNALGFINDGFVRVMVFAKNLETISNPSQISVFATDDASHTTPIEIEYMGGIAGQSWLKQLNLKLPSNSLSGKCVQLRLSVAEVSSNAGRICLLAK